MPNKDFQNGLIVALASGVTIAEGGNIGYQVKFKVDGNDYYIASCQQGESITEPPKPTKTGSTFTKWQDTELNYIEFPFTPQSDITCNAVWGSGDLLLTCDDFTDSGIHQLTLTNNGAEIDYEIKKFGTGSWHFVEGSDYVRINNPSTIFDFANNDFTIYLWLYPTAFTGGIYSAWTNSTARSFILTTAGTAGLLFATSYSSSQSVMIQTENNVLTLNEWQHIAVTRHTGTIYIFVNGTLVKSQVVGASYTINPIGNNDFLIGKNGDSSQYNDHTTGYIDELRILNGTCAWTENFMPPTQPY